MIMVPMDFDPLKKDNSEYFLSLDYINELNEKIYKINKSINAIDDIQKSIDVSMFENDVEK